MTVMEKEVINPERSLVRSIVLVLVVTLAMFLNVRLVHQFFYVIY